MDNEMLSMETIERAVAVLNKAAEIANVNYKSTDIILKGFEIATMMERNEILKSIDKRLEETK